MVFNNPLPASLVDECQKCGRILQSFIDPRASFGADKVIPPAVLERAKGLAILTVVKAGFLGSARFGSGLVVARRPDGSWSAPSAIGTFGAGFGGQIGVEITDFVFILNDTAAVMTFAQTGSVTLGGNVSVAAGPVGRNAEAAGAASLHGFAGIFSYSKTKGLFAGVSLEGSAIVERKDANEKLYGRKFRARELLMGSVEPPAEAAPLMIVLNSRRFGGLGQSDAPVDPAATHNGQESFGQQPQGHGVGGGSAWSPPPPAPAPVGGRTASWGRNMGATSSGGAAAATATADKRVPPPRPTAPKPKLEKRQEAVAVYTFEADQEGDLGFAKGDVITIVKKTDNEADWWTGRIGEREGIFPSNYVKMRE